MFVLHVGAVVSLVLINPTGAAQTTIKYPSILVRAFEFLSRTLTVGRWAQGENSAVPFTYSGETCHPHHRH
jgi:hypothetical protein